MKPETYVTPPDTGAEQFKTESWPGYFNSCVPCFEMWKFLLLRGGWCGTSGLGSLEVPQGMGEICNRKGSLLLSNSINRIELLQAKVGKELLYFKMKAALLG